MIENARSPTGLFDYYEVRARVVPAVLVFSPLVVTCISFAYAISHSVPWTASSGVVAFAVLYVLSFVVRTLGRRTEADLWAKWNGPPSTRFMRWQDDFFSPQAKKGYHDAIREEFGIQLKDKVEEHTDQSEADKLIMDAFRRVKSLVRIEDPKGLWNAHNAEYGFIRNIIGSRFLWLILSLLGTILCGYLYYLRGAGLSLACLVVSGLSAVLALICCCLHPHLAQFAKQVADRYSESAWGSFMAIHRKRETHHHQRK